MTLHDERNLPRLAGTVCCTKLRNAFKRARPDLTPTLKNIRINGQLQGCSGFVTDPATGKAAYVSTDANHGTTRQALCRTARDTRDFTGGPNRFCGMDPEEIVETVTELLTDEATR